MSPILLISKPCDFIRLTYPMKQETTVPTKPDAVIFRLHFSRFITRGRLCFYATTFCRFAHSDSLLEFCAILERFGSAVFILCLCRAASQVTFMRRWKRMTISLLTYVGTLVCATTGVLYSDYFDQQPSPDIVSQGEHLESENGNHLETSESSYDFRKSPRFKVYEDTSNWGCSFKACSGLHQSPIKIETDKLYINPRLVPLESPSYGNPVDNVIAKNVGFAVDLIIPKDIIIPIYEGGLGATYKLVKISFNWRNDSSRGSLHTVDEKYFPLEVVFIHRNIKYNGQLNKPDLEVRISTFGTISEEDNDFLKPIVEVLPKIHLPDDWVKIKKPLSIRKLLPPDADHYVRYKGSMDIPPCYEGVLWYILHQSISISEKQLHEFRKLARNRPEDPPPRFKEYRTGREIQQLNNRIVESTPFVEDHTTDSTEAKDIFY